MSKNINLYILVMFAVTYLVRALPITLIRRKIRSPFLKSFLYYVPYVTLAVMTFPAIIESTQTPYSGIMALAAGIVAAWFGASLFQVASLCCVVVLIAEFIIV
ncbi:MAG: AzlD domain-containing protein [Lachnospiraceae bacterium]|nr:AzlD domain-containing protein [Lachnospiraceae bacterium]